MYANTASRTGNDTCKRQFTTATYPPPYDPALMWNSRRYFTLHSYSDSPVVPVTRPLATSHGLDAFPKAEQHPPERPRSPGGSSTCSNPASEVLPEIWETENQVDASQVALSEPRPCAKCLREADTYLVELINYPALQSAKIRSHVLSKGNYDAVLLVYDVGDRKTFETIMDLHSEIPLGKRWRRASHSNIADKTKRGIFGRGAMAGNKAGETVVALIGNKADFDAEYASIELGLDGPLSEKMAVLEEVDLEERSLMHPLFRESRCYDETNSRNALPPAMSPGAQTFHGRSTYRQEISEVRRSVLSADHILDSRFSILSLQRSVRSVPTRKRDPVRSFARRHQEDQASVVENWLDIRKSNVDQESIDSPREELCTRGHSTDTASTTAAKRQVSKLEGEMLARTLLLQVPFFETSAKTGENIEEAFAEIVQAVLKEMGLDTTNEKERKALQLRCDREHACQKQYTKQGTLPEAVIPKQSHAQTDPGDVPTAAGDIEKMHQRLSEIETPAQRPARRETGLQRMKRVFTKKPPAMVPDVAAC